eukprot:gene24088-biopygen22360
MVPAPRWDARGPLSNSGDLEIRAAARDPPGRNGCGRVPGASHTIDFEEPDASRARPQPFLPGSPELAARHVRCTGYAILCAVVRNCPPIDGTVLCSDIECTSSAGYRTWTPQLMPVLLFNRWVTHRAADVHGGGGDRGRCGESLLKVGSACMRRCCAHIAIIRGRTDTIISVGTATSGFVEVHGCTCCATMARIRDQTTTEGRTKNSFGKPGQVPLAWGNH